MTSSFYGLQPRMLTPDRLYLIRISHAMVAGAVIAGQFSDQRSASAQLQGAGIILWPWVRLLHARRAAREASLEQCDFFAPSFVHTDPRNFQLSRTEIARARYRRSRSLWTAHNSGSVEFTLFDGRSRRFILVGDEEPEYMLELLTGFYPAVEVTGQPAERPRPRTARDRRIMFRVLGLHLVGFGVLFMGAAVNGRRGVWLNIAVAILNFASGFWVFSLASRIKDDPSGVDEAFRGEGPTLGE